LVPQQPLLVPIVFPNPHTHPCSLLPFPPNIKQLSSNKTPQQNFYW
jgi:hypothetical protein